MSSFLPNLPKKGVSGLKQKREHDHWILHIRISLGTKFLLKPTILIFWTKFAQKGCFQSKAEKVNSATEFSTLELVYVQNFSLHWQFWLFFDQFCPKNPGKIALVRASMVVTYYKTFLQGCWQTQRYFNVPSPSTCFFL